MEQVAGLPLQVADADPVLYRRLCLVDYLLIGRAQGAGRAVGQARDAQLVGVKRDQRPPVGGDDQRAAHDDRRFVVRPLSGAEGQIPAPSGMAGRVRSRGVSGRVGGTDPIVVLGPRAQVGQCHLVRPGQIRATCLLAVGRALAEVHEAVGRLVGAPDDGHLPRLRIPDARSGDDRRGLQIPAG